MDRISGLPNEIICHIVSFLSAKEAALAMVLAKRWQNIFTIISKLEFDDRVENQGSMMEFLGGVLALPDSSLVKKIILKCVPYGTLVPANYDEVKSRLSNVLKCGVLELEFDLQVGNGFSLPSEVFTCKTLVELKLGTHLKIELLPENALLPELKTLIINEARFSDPSGCAFQKLISACPVLVELVMHNVQWESWQWSRIVSSPSLQRLTINHRYFYYDIDTHHYDLESITFDIPNLTYLDYIDFAPRSYPVVNLGSLVEAKIGLALAYDQAWMGQYAGGGNIVNSDITNLIKGLRNVEILDVLNTKTLKAFSFFRKAFPVFENLHHLTVQTERKNCWRTLPYLLKNSPIIKTLVLVGPLHYKPPSDDYDSNLSDNDTDEPDYDSDDEEEWDDTNLICECLSGYSFLESCPLKVLEITEYSGTSGELEHLRHFLEKLSCLELVKIRSHEWDVNEKFQLNNNVLYLPRSSKCNIEFEFVPLRFANQSV